MKVTKIPIHPDDSQPTAAEDTLKVEHSEWSPCQCHGDCFYGAEESCTYKKWWPTTQCTFLHKETGKGGQKTKSVRETEAIGIAGLVEAGSVIAIESGDAGASYYLLRATGKQRQLTEPLMMGGFLEAAGTFVIDGEWFGRVGKKERVFQLLDQTETVTTNSIRFILPGDPFNIDHRGKMELRDSIHEEIMRCL